MFKMSKYMLESRAYVVAGCDCLALQFNKYSPTGDLFKALDGTNSNLRYDVPTDQLQFYYKLEGAGAPNKI